MSIEEGEMMLNFVIGLLLVVTFPIWMSIITCFLLVVLIADAGAGFRRAVESHR